MMYILDRVCQRAASHALEGRLGEGKRMKTKRRAGRGRLDEGIEAEGGTERRSGCIPPIIAFGRR